MKTNIEDLLHKVGSIRKNIENGSPGGLSPNTFSVRLGPFESDDQEAESIAEVREAFSRTHLKDRFTIGTFPDSADTHLFISFP